MFGMVMVQNNMPHLLAQSWCLADKGIQYQKLEKMEIGRIILYLVADELPNAPAIAM